MKNVPHAVKLESVAKFYKAMAEKPIRRNRFYPIDDLPDIKVAEDIKVCLSCTKTVAQCPCESSVVSTKPQDAIYELMSSYQSSIINVADLTTAGYKSSTVRKSLNELVSAEKVFRINYYYPNGKRKRRFSFNNMKFISLKRGVKAIPHPKIYELFSDLLAVTNPNTLELPIDWKNNSVKTLIYNGYICKDRKVWLIDKDFLYSDDLLMEI